MGYGYANHFVVVSVHMHYYPIAIIGLIYTLVSNNYKDISESLLPPKFVSRTTWIQESITLQVLRLLSHFVSHQSLLTLPPLLTD